MNNPLMKCGYPDLDVIWVGDTYYMLSTAMHFPRRCHPALPVGGRTPPNARQRYRKYKARL